MGILLLALAGLSLAARGNAVTNAPGTNALHLQEFIQKVLDRNESVQLRVLEVEIAQRKHAAEFGVFEPDFVLGASREENKRENTAEQRRSLRLTVFDEENNVYRSGLESLVPSGARVRLGYTMRDLNNNLQDPRIAPGTIATNRGKIDEYQSFVGLNVTQPLLKGFGRVNTYANIRIAALASDIAFQEYRRQVMETIATAEAAYWNLFMMQEQVQFFRESVAMAEGIVRDNRVRAETGVGSELEVLEAEAALALRQTKLVEAEQKRKEAELQAMTLFADSTLEAQPVLQAIDQPHVGATIPEFFPSAEAALDLNPDYLAQISRIRQEDIRIAFAKNQRLPQLDLLGSYGLNGLGDSPSESHGDLERQSYPSFSIGFELHIPLGGNIRAKNEFAAARLRKEQALLSLKQVETQVINAVQSAVQKIRSARESVANNRKVVAFHESLLRTQLERLQVGRVESRKVLEVEAALFESRNAVLDALVQYERAELELQLVQGAILKERELDFTRAQLKTRTEKLIEERKQSPIVVPEMPEVPMVAPAPPLAPAELDGARRSLRRKLDSPAPELPKSE